MAIAAKLDTVVDSFVPRVMPTRNGTSIATFLSSMRSQILSFLLVAGAAYAAESSTGVKCFEQKDFACAAREWQALAEKGVPQAQYNLGLLYARGLGVPKDPAKAAELYQQASNYGIVQAQYNLAHCYLNGIGLPKDEDQAISWFQKAADLGDPNAANNLATILEHRKDYANAMKWYKKAAGEGLPKAQFNLGQMYDLGLGMPQDFVEAANWYQKAADQGDAGGLCNLAILYYNGQGVPVDRVKAYQFFMLAFKAGDERATNLMGRTANKLKADQIAKAGDLARSFESSHPLKYSDELSAPQPIMDADSKVSVRNISRTGTD